MIDQEEYKIITILIQSYILVAHWILESESFTITPVSQQRTYLTTTYFNMPNFQTLKTGTHPLT